MDEAQGKAVGDNAMGVAFMSATQMPFQEFAKGMSDGSLSPEYAPWTVLVLPWASINGGPPYVIWVRDDDENSKEFVAQGE
jgi:hypothetical protein